MCVCVCVCVVCVCDREASIIGVSLLYCVISFSTSPCRSYQTLRCEHYWSCFPLVLLTAKMFVKSNCSAGICFFPQPIAGKGNWTTQNYIQNSCLWPRKGLIGTFNNKEQVEEELTLRLQLLFCSLLQNLYMCHVGRVAQSVQRLATGWTVRGSNPGGRRDFPHLSRPALGPTQLPVQWVPGLSRG